MDVAAAMLTGEGALVGLMASLFLTSGRRPSAARGERSPLDLLVELALSSRWVRSWREHEELEYRRASCLSEMPQFLDIITLGLTAGLSFDASLELYCTSFDNGLSRLFGEAMMTWRMGLDTRSGALERLAREMDVQALRSFSSVVTEALEFGTPLSAALEHQAQAIRDEQRAEVEESIEKVPVKMLIPMGTLIVPAMLLAILGPLLGSAIGIG